MPSCAAAVAVPSQLVLLWAQHWWQLLPQAIRWLTVMPFLFCVAGYTVNVSRIAPLAQNISQAGSDLLDEEGKPYLLIQPVIQVRTCEPKLLLLQQRSCWCAEVKLL